MARYTESIYSGAGYMGKSGTKAYLVRRRQQATDRAIREMELSTKVSPKTPGGGGK